MGQQVLVFPASILDGTLPRFDGVLTGLKVEAYLDEILRPSNLRFVDRDLAETDPNYKQLISYCVLTDQQGRVFAYQRTKKGGEPRLHDLWSVGVGGHIEPIDGYTDIAYEFGFYRELSEEVGLLFKKDNCRETVIGLLYDPSDDVGLVHFGVVHQIIVTDDTLRCKDNALAHGRFMPVAWLKKDVQSFENWSKLVINELL